MNYERLLDKKEKLLKIQTSNSENIFENFNKAFEIEYAHNSTAIEGNTLTLIETKVLLEDKISIGRKSLREIYEVVNHNKAFSYVKNCIAEDKPLDENIVKDIHSILMENILVGGIYRNVDVRITGAKHKPPVPSEMYYQIKDFFSNLNFKSDLNPIELASWTHAEFVKIHPFVDGNGRTSRLITNYQLMKHGFLPVSVNKEDKLDYFNFLEEYAVNGNLEPFADFVAELEERQLDEYLSIIR
ncbi:Fic family protein [Ruminococcus sp. YE282]|uniref:Fic family protein n=1 Tax=Ruminococcus sp. YE282 TaxID=3158780 RepID=UPI00087F489B|nr:Fic/DOC family protein [Ruminococcus bromii]